MTEKKWLIVILLLAAVVRLYRLTSVPPALHGDELGAGYNAYSLLKTGRDEYGTAWPLSFRQNISPLNFYLMIPFVVIFGLSDLAVRLPGTLWGLVTILLVYVLAQELMQGFPKRWKRVPLLAAFLLAVSPWHVQTSRIAHDATLGLLMQTAAVVVFLKTLYQPRRWLMWASLFGISLYAYHAPKVTTPLLLGWLVICFWPQLRTHTKMLWKSLAVVGLLAVPLIVSMICTPLRDNRLVGVSIFVRDVTLKPVLSHMTSATLVAEKLLFYNPLLIYGMAFLHQYGVYLNPEYLWFDASTVRYFNVSRVGLLYVAEVPWLLFGVWTLIKRRPVVGVFLLGWLAIAPVAGALTLGPPNAGRVMLWLPTLYIFTAAGVVETGARLVSHWRRIIFGIVVMAWLYNVALFGYQYFAQSENEFALRWGYGLKEAVQRVSGLEPTVQHIVMSDAFKQGYIYVLFYGKKEPGWWQQVHRVRHPSIGYERLGKWEFRQIHFLKDEQLESIILIGTADDIPATASGVTTIFAPDGSIAVRIKSNDAHLPLLPVPAK